MKDLWTTRTRAVIAGLVLTLVFSGFSYRLVQLHRISEREAVAKVEAEHQVYERRHQLLARRGTILDARNELLARDLQVSTVIADHNLMTDPLQTAQVMARHLNLDPDLLLTRLSQRDPYIVVQKRVPRNVALEMQTELRERGLRGVRVEHDFRREYPQFPLLSGMIGITDYENRGVIGVEHSLNDLLAGTDGHRTVLVDRNGRELLEFSRDEQQPVDGQSVRLTVDLGIQNLIEEQLDALEVQWQPEKISIVCVDPQTGNIMGMGSRLKSADEQEITNPAKRRNPAIMDQFEPGSIFKVIATSAAINEGLVNANTPIDCEWGSFRYGGSVLHDIGSYNTLSVQDVIVKSSNIGTAKMALMLGQDRLYHYISEYGFGQKTGLGLSGEIAGTSHSPRSWSKVSITRIPIGQGIAVTPLQMAMAFSVIANDGYLVQPRLVDAITDERGVTFEKQPVVKRRRVISNSTAQSMRTILNQVVTEKGTGKRAMVDGFHVCGKTGTAQKARPDGRGYMDGVYVVSFIGFLPRDNPAFVLLVTVDAPQAPKAEYYGGVIAAPAFAALSARIADYLGLARDYAVTEDVASGPLASRMSSR